MSYHQTRTSKNGDKCPFLTILRQCIGTYVTYCMYSNKTKPNKKSYVSCVQKENGFVVDY